MPTTAPTQTIKCVVVTNPDASGKCPKDQVLYSENNVNKCAPAAVMEKDATLGEEEEQPAQPGSGGGSGCSLIREGVENHPF